MVTTARRWDGTQWVNATARRWDGTQWVTVHDPDPDPQPQPLWSVDTGPDQGWYGWDGVHFDTEMKLKGTGSLVSVGGELDADYGFPESVPFNTSTDQILINVRALNWTGYVDVGLFTYLEGGGYMHHKFTDEGILPANPAPNVWHTLSLTAANSRQDVPEGEVAIVGLWVYAYTGSANTVWVNHFEAYPLEDA